MEEDIGNDIVVELSLTEGQVHHLQWILHCWLQQYLDGESSPLKEDVLAIQQALEGI